MLFTMELPQGVLRVLAALSAGGYEGYVVGGCVRDALMGKVANDFDITTSASPQEMLRCFDGLKTVETGIKHGTLTVVTDKMNIEVTAYRIDGEYIDNRHPDSVTFTDKLSADLARRDFTVNAMAYNPARGLVDLFGGAEHIRDRRIVCVGNPDKRFCEDGLRIMRALRFAATLGFTIDSETSRAARCNRELLKNISVERIYAEFIKLLCGVNASKILSEYRDIIGVFLPETVNASGRNSDDNSSGNSDGNSDDNSNGSSDDNSDGNADKNSDGSYDHCVETVSRLPREKNLRLAALLHCRSDGSTTLLHGGEALADECESILRRLRADKKTITAAATLVRHLSDAIPSDEASVRRLISDLSAEGALSLLQLRRACIGDSPELDEALEAAQKIISAGACVSLKSLAVSGDDIISLGIGQGREVGKLLELLYSMVLDGRIENSRESLLDEARRHIS